MAEPPKRPADVSRAEAPRVVKPTKPAGPSNETARAVDSVPLSVGPFAVLPTQFGRYRIEKLLGKGAMGAVYLAHDTQLERSVALKVARVSSAGSAKLIKRMETEAKAAAKIDHPLICKVFDFGEIDGIRFIALQYIAGEDLKSYLQRVGRKRAPAEALSLILQMARALKAAHAKGVIHRDLKPENVMLNENGEPVIMDFGLARRLTGATDAGLTQGMIVGTAAYMSPEQAIGKAEGIDHRSDLYALGVMLFEMLTGEWPFTGSAIEVMGRKAVQEAPSPLSIDSNVSPQLADICHKLIAQKKEDRFATSEELIAALEAVDLQAPEAMEMDVEFESASSPFSRPRETAGAPIRQKPTKSRPRGRIASPLFRSLEPLTTWWRDQPTAFRWTIVGATSACVLLLAMAFFRGDNAPVKAKVAPLFDEWALSTPFGTSKWTMLDGGILVGSGDGWLATKQNYSDFEISLEYQLPIGGDSGVFVRASPSGPSSGSEFLEIQLTDDVDPKTSNSAITTHTGSLYRIEPRKLALNTATNQWHSLRVRAVKQRIQVNHDVKDALDVYLNSVAIPTAVKSEPSGRIGLQSRGTAGVRFRNIEIRDLTNVTTKAPNDSLEWKELFNGRDLAGWTPRGSFGWRVSNGVLIGELVSGQTSGWLMSDETFDNFEVDLEYMLASDSNSGIILKAQPAAVLSATDYVEIQLIDDLSKKFGLLDSKTRTGSIWNLVASNPAPNAPANSWHRVQVKVEDRRVTVTVNGTVVVNAPNAAPAKPGRLGLQLAPNRVEFRNIKVRHLPTRRV